ncbi:hypothetical protein MTYP_02888 [Methylophilaceae bacterium]|nr:hypothetical protein MTYP_02888 [Methylophilaceae bacterium]
MVTTRIKRPMNQEFRKLHIPLAWTVTALTLSLSPISHAADWKITPSLDLRETYTDNVRLASAGNNKSDFITQVSPGVSVAGIGSRLKVNMRYAMQNTAHAREDSQIMTSHQLNANGNAELMEDLFFLDGKAGLSQQNISLFGPQTTDNTYLTGNRANVATYSISPYLRNRFGSIATSELRYTHDEVRTRVGGLSNSKGDSVLFNLSSGPEFSKLGWGLHYSKHRTDYSSFPSVNTESYSGSLRFMITPKFSLTATKGYEKNDYLSIGAKPEGDFWTAEFSWTPSARTSLAASTGHRFFGRTQSLTASHRSRNTIWSANYSEDINTTRSQFQIPVPLGDYLDQFWTPSIPDPVIRQQFLDRLMRENGLPSSLLLDSLNYFTNRFFLQKRLQASVAINSAKSTVIFSAVRTEREAQTAQGMDSLLYGSSNLALNDHTKVIGGNAVWNWRFSPRTNFNINTGYTRSRSISTGITDINRTAGLGMTRQFRPKLNGAVNLRHNERDTTQSAGNYRENSIFATLHMTF